MTTREHLINHYKAYPKLQITDIFKFLFQSSFGCEHLVSSEEATLGYIRRELESVQGSHEWRVDLLDGNYSRVHLSSIGANLTPEVLTKHFCLSAKTEDDGKEKLITKLEVARELIEEGALPFSLQDFDCQHSLWREAGYPAIHHSDIFREEYHPHYRVIANEYVEDIHKLTKE